jgi:hypothetical protein
MYLVIEPGNYDGIIYKDIDDYFRGMDSLPSDVKVIKLKLEAEELFFVIIDEDEVLDWFEEWRENCRAEAEHKRQERRFV